MPAAKPDAVKLLKLIDGESHVALAVSGGSDSMALLRLAHQRAEPGTKLTALTVDHGLRADSTAEARKVSAWSAALGISHVTLRWDGTKPSTGLQAKARIARYGLMAGWCKANGVNCLLTAHTLEDQAETVIMRLARTASIDSIAGIHPQSPWLGISVLRPLLGERREELRRYLRSLGQPWIDDPSNEDERFERVRVRRAMPDLARLGLGPEALAALASEARELSVALQGAAAEWTGQHAREHDTGYCLVPLRELTLLPDALSGRVLGALVCRFGSGHGPEPREIADLRLWLKLEGAGKRTLGGAVIAKRARDLVIGREPGRIDRSPVPVPSSGTLIWDRRFEISAPQGMKVLPLAVAGIWPRRTDIPAFVQAGLPAILGEGDRIAIPHMGIGEGVTARFAPDRA